MLLGNHLIQKTSPIADKFRAAGSESRTAILAMLLREPMTFSVLVRKLELSPSLTLHHLKILLKSGWITRSKFGKLVTYYLSDSAVKEVVTFLRK